MTSRTLLIVRHAKSDWATGESDHERPLNDRGRVEAPELGRQLAERGLRPDLVICSDATRAQQTWDGASAAWDPNRPALQVDSRLYDASRSAVLDVITATPGDVGTLACVGHEPTSSALAALLAGTGEPGVADQLARGLKTACAVVLTYEGDWSDLEPGLGPPGRRGVTPMTATPPGEIAATPTPPYVAVIFTSRRTGQDDDGYAAMAVAMDRLSAEQPGYLGIESARDGLGITVSYWQDEASARAWKQVAAHLGAQRMGRERWYTDYKVRIATITRDYDQAGSDLD